MQYTIVDLPLCASLLLSRNVMVRYESIRVLETLLASRPSSLFAGRQQQPLLESYVLFS